MWKYDKNAFNSISPDLLCHRADPSTLVRGRPHTTSQIDDLTIRNSCDVLIWVWPHIAPFFEKCWKKLQDLPWCFNQVVDQSLCRVCRSIEQGSVALRNSIRWRYFLNFFLQDLRRHIQNICQEHTSPNYMIKAWTNVECTLLSLTYIWKHLQVVWYWSLLFCDQIFYKIFEWATNQKGGTGHWANMVFRFCL